MIRQTIVTGLPSIFGHRCHTCNVELSQLFASYFGSFKQSQKVQPRCGFFYDMVVWLCSPLKIASLMIYLSLRAHKPTSTPLMSLERLMTLICSLPLSKDHCAARTFKYQGSLCENETRTAQPVLHVHFSIFALNHRGSKSNQATLVFFFFFFFFSCTF